MWLLDYVVDLLKLAEATRENKEEIKTLRRDLEELTIKVELVANDQRHQVEKLALRVENELLRFEKRLPPSRSGK